MIDTTDILSQNIKYLMDKAKISSITELARRLQLNQPTLHRLVSGEVKDRSEIRNVKADRRLLPRVTNRPGRKEPSRNGERGRDGYKNVYFS